MTLRCSICRLPEQKRAAVDAALAAGDVSLIEVSASSGLSKSSLQRHSKHLTGVQKPETPDPLPAVIQDLVSEAPAPTKESLLERIELLWNESLDGLAVSKEPVTITKPDGTTLELPGDLRARAGFIREARSVLELQGAASGELIKGQPNLIGGVWVVYPSPSPSAVATAAYQVIDIAVPKR